MAYHVTEITENKSVGTRTRTTVKSTCKPIFIVSSRTGNDYFSRAGPSSLSLFKQETTTVEVHENAYYLVSH